MCDERKQYDQVKANIAGQAVPFCDVPIYIEHRQRLESRKYQLQREIEEVEWALKKIESDEVKEAFRLQEVINRTNHPL